MTFLINSRPQNNFLYLPLIAPLLAKKKEAVSFPFSLFLEWAAVEEGVYWWKEIILPQ